MNGFQKLAVVILGVLALGLVGASGANAGTYVMRQCDGSSFLDFQGTYSAINASPHFDAVSGCVTSGSGKLGIYQDRSGTSLAYGEGGHFVWAAPTGTEVIGARIAARLNDKNNIQAQLNGYNVGVHTDIDGGIPHDGSDQVSYWSDPAHPQWMVVIELLCQSVNGCANQVGGTKAFLEVTDTEFTVRDTVAPTAAASGTLWDWGGDSGYHRGTASIGIDATDQGSGVAATWVEINGLRVDLPAPTCPGDKGDYTTRFTPCPLTYSTIRTFDTSVSPFQEGSNQIRVCSRDYASSEANASKTCSATRTVLIDNRFSNPADNLRSDQGTDWQPVNGFTLRWEIPEGQVAPIIGAVYKIQELETDTLVDAGYFSGNDIQSAGPINLPAVGAYKVIIHLVDGALNLGRDAETILRFDDRPPGDVSPVEPEGWISRDELPIQQEIEKAAPGGPSGISGYALEVSDDGPAQPCGSEICLAPEITLAGGPDLRTGSIGGLVEGNHWISAAAVSGAHKSSVEPGSTMVQVDRTPPTVSISGVPNEWVNHPVTLTAQASDQLSGMQPQPADDGSPKTVIDADNYAAYESPGPFASFSVATEGVNRVRYWAEDLAGNANDGMPGHDGDTHATPGQAVVRIDTTPPEVRFDPARDPEDPEVVRISADDTDSGVASASIGIRRAGSGETFIQLQTAGADGQYQARIPSDDLAQGAYELNATVEDRAGNESTGNRTSAGDPMIVNLPVKQPASIAASLTGGKSNILARYGSARYLEGRLTSGDTALSNQTVTAIETFKTGSSRNAVSRDLITDGDGRFRVLLTPGPSRTIEVTYAGTRMISRTAGPKLGMRVKGKVTLKIKPKKVLNGGVVRMSGKVGFAGVLPPSRGKLVAIQYFDPSRRKWRPVEVLRTNRRGLFRYRYRFRTITSAQRILFRASALPEAGWPYLPSTTKPKSVIVYPKD